MSTPILPLAVWPSGINEASIPANDNALRCEILFGLVISDSVTAQPVSPSDGDIYIIPAAATGAQWATFDEFDLVIYKGGTWSAYAPVEGIVVNLAGELMAWDGTEYASVGGGGGGSTIGRQSIYITAGAMLPSASGGSAAVAIVTTGANQPDLVTLDFDPTTQEFAQFSLVMPKKWNLGTISFIPHWSHPSTTTNFGVVWALQAVAVGNDDAIGVAYGTAQTSTDTGGTTNDLYSGPESSAITVGGSPADEEMVFFRIARNVSDGSDNLAVDARLHGLTIYLTTDADTDA